MHLSPRALQGLKSYTYKASGYTVLDELHNPIWTWLVEKLPLWFAPNLVTLTGTACVFAAYMLNIIYLPAFMGEAPRWLHLFTALAVFLYVNLDCMDGKQARRTRSSSPLGQLFDHGCDALALHMLLGNIAASLGFPCSWKMAAGVMGVMVPWILAQWEEYHTGIMVYGTRYYGVLEANYAICAVHLASAALGQGFWQQQLPGVLLALLGPVLGPHATVGELSIVLVASAGIAQASHNIRRVFFSKDPPGSLQQLPEKERGHKVLGRGAAALDLCSLATFLVLGAWWIHQCGSSGGGVFECRVVYSTVGVLYALVASQLIMAHMCKEPFAPPLMPSAVICCALLNGSMAPRPVLPPASMAFVLHAAVLAWYATYVLGCMRQICEHLGIKAFVIPVLPPVEGKAK